MTWPIIAFFSTIALSVAIILQRALMKDDKSDAISFAIVFQFGLGIISLILAIIFGKLSLPNFDQEMIIRFAISTIGWSGGTIFTFKAAQKLAAGELTILNTSSSLIAITIGILFLNEPFGLKQASGALLIFAAIIIVNARKLSFESKEGIAFAFIAAGFAGVAVSNDAFIIKDYEAFSYTTLMSFLPIILMVSLFPKKALRIPKIINFNFVRVMTLLSFFYSIQAITYYLAFEAGAPVSQLSPLIKSSIVLTVILGVIFLNERKDLGRKFAASIIVTLGAILLG